MKLEPERQKCEKAPSCRVTVPRVGTAKGTKA
jgi:hypothetical protein